MLYYLFDYLDKHFDLPGTGVFQYITFRSAAAVLLSLILSTVFGKQIINFIRRKQIGETIRELGLDEEIVNVNGGAIALGHPLGCTGAKLTLSLIHEMRRRDVQFGVVTMCIGGCMGAAGVFELL